MRLHRPHRRLLLAATIMSVIAALLGSAAAAQAGDRRAKASWHGQQATPLVIAHRGASGYRPEHTLASYTLAARMGADYIETDVVPTKDSVLVARHEHEISETTDVADHPEFASRKTTKTLEGKQFTGWFTEDFTLAELRTLRAKERLPDVRQRNTIYNGRYQVPTFQEVIDLSRKLSRNLGRKIGIYVETKNPTYFSSIGLPLEPRLVHMLRRNGLAGRRAKVFVQSFETKGLRWIDRRIDAPLVALFDDPNSEPADRVGSGTTYADLASARGLRRLSRYVDGVGPEKDYVIPRDEQGRSLPPTSFVKDAHRAGLLVHPYTFRAENQFLPAQLRSSSDPNSYGNLFGEIGAFLDAGVDGFFTDNADIGRDTVDER